MGRRGGRGREEEGIVGVKMRSWNLVFWKSERNLVWLEFVD